MILALLIFLNGISQIQKTIASSEFWWWVVGIIGIGLILDLWAILYERIELKDNKIISYVDWGESGEILDFISVKERKTIYFNSLGFEYNLPKGKIMRFLLPYKHYNPKTMQAIMQEILRLNPQIKLEDDLVKQMVNGTYKNRLFS